MPKITFTVDEADAGRLEALAAAYRGNKTAAFRHALSALEDARSPAPPTLAADVWATLAAGARGRLRRALTEPELAVCLRATRSWWVTGADAHMIHSEVADMDIEAAFGPGDPVFGDGPAPGGAVDTKALAGKLGAMPDFDRAVLTLACRDWWATDPREPLTAVLGGPLRGSAGMN